MCDFRNPPTGVYDYDEQREYSVPFLGNYSFGVSFKGQEPGFYYLIGTGSHYAYWDGEGCWGDRDGWGPPSEKYWQETGGYPPKFVRFDFKFPHKPKSFSCHFGDFTVGNFPPYMRYEIPEFAKYNFPTRFLSGSGE